jgi:DNA-binding transcriptional LysR family regulator
MPTLRQVRYFLTVAELDGFTQAAAALCIAQSALSRQIALLEDELGFLLFEREPRGVRLTTAGAAYRDRVKAIPNVMLAAAEEGRQVARGQAGVLKLLHSSTVPVRSLMPVLDRFMEICPNARIDLDRASSEEQISEVANGNADIGVIRMPVLRRDSRVRFVELTAERLWVALPGGHRLAKQTSAMVASLRDELFVSAVYRERGGLARVVTDLCLKRGFVPQPAQIVSPKTSMLSLVSAERGIAIVPERMTALGGQGIIYVPLSDEDARSVCALVLPLQPALLTSTFADILLKEIT